MFHTISTVVVILLVIGLAVRKNKKVHVPLMISAFSVDLASVVAIEISRGAIQKAVTAPPPLLIFHVLVSVAALAFYGVMFFLGERVRSGATHLRPWHRRTAWVFGACRAANYVTSWMI